ncbi:P-loop containing nucleoside triphosphate hydrolase protein [Paraphysoderma sedebokerense]|nr:P-loop containing nucleoside triphosphate hydrolase protein [Paraphysoderma sedebokerense]
MLSLSAWIYTWMSPMLIRGSSGSIDVTDVWDLAKDDKSLYAWSKFRTKKEHSESNRIFKPLFSAVRELLVMQIFCGIAFAFFTFTGPLFLNRIVGFIENFDDTGGHGKYTKKDIWMAYVYVFGMFICTILNNLFDARAAYCGFRAGFRVKAILISEIYQKSLCRSAVQPKVEDDEDSPTSVGKITNLHSTDSSKLHGYTCFIHYLFVTPIRILIGISSLYWVLGWSALTGIAIMVVLIPIQSYLSKCISKEQKKVMEWTDKRLNLMNEMLSSIRIVKFFAWEDQFNKKISETRKSELSQMRRYFIFGALSQAIYTSSLIFVSLITFSTYTKIAGQLLNATVVFTSVSLFASLTDPLDDLAYRITQFFEVRVSALRIRKFLMQENMDYYLLHPLPPTVQVKAENESVPVGQKLSELSIPASSSYGTFTSSSYTINQMQPSLPKIGFKNATFTWDPAFITTKSPSSSKHNPTATILDTDTVIASDQSSSFALSDVSVVFPNGGLTIVAGLTASGKSSLLQALLGEMRKLEGEVYLPEPSYAYDENGQNMRKVVREDGLHDGVAYVPQQAWLMNDTIRNNILFGEPYDEERYHQVIQVCHLTRDLEILQGGDLTEIGEKGINLSGGQKQRVSLARACYSKARHLILDDVLSALDASVAKSIFEDCITSFLSDRTRILVSHAVALTVPRADHIVVLKNGYIISQGPLTVVKSELLEKATQEYHLFDVPFEIPENEDGTSETDDAVDSKMGNSIVIGDNVKAATKKGGTTLIKEENKSEGRVAWDVYKLYLKAAGGVKFWIFFFCGIIIAKLFSIGADNWLRLWAKSYGTASEMPASDNISTIAMLSAISEPILDLEKVGLDGYLQSATMLSALSTAHPYLAPAANSTAGQTPEHGHPDLDSSVNFYLGVYAAISFATVVANFAQVMYKYYGSLTASSFLHSKTLSRVLRSPVSFFDTTPLGRIVNRFARDMEQVDIGLMHMINNFISIMFGMASEIILVGAVTPAFLIAAPFIGYLYFVICDYYLKTTRELKRFDSVSRSPVYSHFSETLAGVSVIRAYRVEKAFIEKNFQKVDFNHRMLFYQIALNRWLSVRTGFADGLVLLFCGLAIILGMDNLDAGLAGFSLSYALTFSSSAVWLIRVHSQLELFLNAVERIGEYTELESEAPPVLEHCRPPPHWPFKGKIQFENLTIKYADDQPPVLKNVSFEVKSGERIGIVGRTGAGKSTLTLALFRFLEPTDGTIFVDGIDITKIGLADLRGNLSIIPQDPVCFAGTIRSNLDVFNEYSDAEIWSALKRVQFVSSNNLSESTSTISDAGNEGAEKIQNAPSKMDSIGTFTGNLDTEVTDNGNNLSVGQRQLLQIARALLRRSKVIVLDEATASIDSQSDARIQHTLRTSEEFATSTMLCIAHRIKTIIDFDKVLVLDDGSVKEFDTPYNLITRNSQFKTMCEETGDFETLFKMAKEKAGRDS